MELQGRVTAYALLVIGVGELIILGQLVMRVRRVNHRQVRCHPIAFLVIGVILDRQLGASIRHGDALGHLHEAVEVVMGDALGCRPARSLEPLARGGPCRG